MDVSRQMVQMYPVVASKHQYAGKKWVQEAVKHIKKGALTKTAKAHGEKPMEFAKEVLEHPEQHTKTTRKRAQFAVNIQRKK